VDAFICTTCGTQFEPTEAPPQSCPVCMDERQYIGALGQSWTTLPKLTRSHMTTFRDEAGLIGIGTSPNFGIGQRALLVRTSGGNILWDCISLVDPAAVELIKGLGGLAGIAISHPHYYTTMLEWSRAFGGVPIHLHAADREWVMRDGPEIAFWEGDTKTIAPGLTLIRCGGHFEGGTVLHHAAGAAGRGALLSGDILQVVADRAHLGFMRSYPNFIPLGAAAVRAVAARLEGWPFDAIYGAFWNAVIPRDAAQALIRSVERHVAWLERPAL
jgi:hypothetical protein